MLKVAGNSTLYSVSADSNTSTTINITPLTDMIIRSWYTAQGASVDTAFTTPAVNPPPTATDVKVISSVVLGIVQGWLQTSGVTTGNFNLISTPFTANGNGVDAVLDQTSVTANNGTITAVVTGSGSSAGITQNSTITPSTGTGKCKHHADDGRRSDEPRCHQHGRADNDAAVDRP